MKRKNIFSQVIELITTSNTYEYSGMHEPINIIDWEFAGLSLAWDGAGSAFVCIVVKSEDTYDLIWDVERSECKSGIAFTDIAADLDPSATYTVIIGEGVSA